MSNIDRFDRGLEDALADLAAARTPDYIDDLIGRAVSRRQRPAWTFPERWVPVSVLARRPTFAPAMPWRTIGLLILLLLLAAALLVVGVGSLLDRTAPPYGLAANGSIVYSENGDIFVREAGTDVSRALISGPENDVAPWFSRDGTKFSFIREISAQPPIVAVMVANADGSVVRTIVPPEPAPGAHWSEWSPDSRFVAVQNSGPDVPALSIVNVDGEPVRHEIGLPVTPEAVDWRPGTDQLLFRGVGDPTAAHAALYTVRSDGTGFRRLTEPGLLNSHMTPFSLSHDGQLIAFSSFHGSDLRVHILDLESGADRVLAGERHQGYPVLSPDGETVAFLRYKDDNPSDITARVVIASVAGDGSDARPVGPAVRITSGTQGLYTQFSPDAKTLLVSHPAEGEGWLVELASGAYEPLPWVMRDWWVGWQRVAP